MKETTGEWEEDPSGWVSKHMLGWWVREVAGDEALTTPKSLWGAQAQPGTSPEWKVLCCNLKWSRQMINSNLYQHQRMLQSILYHFVGQPSDYLGYTVLS